MAHTASPPLLRCRLTRPLGRFRRPVEARMSGLILVAKGHETANHDPGSEPPSKILSGNRETEVWLFHLLRGLAHRRPRAKGEVSSSPLHCHRPFRSSAPTFHTTATSIPGWLRGGLAHRGLFGTGGVVG